MSVAHNPYQHDLHRLAYTLIQQAELGAAHELLLQGLAQNDADDETWQLLGMLASLQGDTETALTLYRQAVALNPQRLLSLKLLGQTAFDAQDLRSALAAFRQAEQLAPQDREVMAGLAITWAGMGKAKRAVPYFSQLADDPAESRVDFLFNAALFEKEQGKLERADELLTRVLQVNPAHAKALLELAEVCKARKEFTRAVDLLRAALAQTPDAEDLRIELLEVLFEANDASYRDEILGLAASDWADPDRVIRAMFVQGRLHEREGQLHDAETYMVSLGKLMPDDAKVRNAVGGFFLRHKHYSQAFNHFMAALPAAGDDEGERHVAMFGVLRCAYGSGASELGRSFMDERLAGESKTVRHRHLLTLALLLRGDGFLEPAVAYAKQVVDENPRHRDAHELLARFMHDEGKHIEEAIEFTRLALTRFPRSFNLHFVMNLLALKVGDLVLARKHIRRALAMEPGHYAARANLGLLYTDEGRSGRALALYQSLLDEAPDHEMANQVRTNYALALTARGDVAAGFRMHRVRHAIYDNIRRHALPVVDADTASMAGRRVLVVAEQGIGDEILYVQFVKDLLDEGAQRVVVEVTPKLLPLFRRSYPDVVFVPRQKSAEAVPQEQLDCQIVAGDLMERHLLRVGHLNQPRKPFMRADMQRTAWWRQTLEGLRTAERPLNIGVCWRSSLRIGRREHFWPQWEQWLELLKQDHVNWVNVQYDSRPEELAQFAAHGIHLHHYPQVDQFNDLDEVAAMVGALDLVISAPVSVPMIASAVGTPSWVFTPRFAWPLLGTGRMPMVPYTRPFIRGFREGWEQPMQRMQQALAARVAARESSKS